MKEMREPESRAPQFAAYESLRGYGELIEECKFVPDERVELSEEEIEKLSLLLSSLRKGIKAATIQINIFIHFGFFSFVKCIIDTAI